MRKIVNNKVYDTETARKVGEWANSDYVTDFDWYSEELYQKKTGEYFVYGEGNARSPYAEHSGGEWVGGEAITPVSLEQARDWAESHLDAEDYEREFGTPEEGDAVITCRISAGAKAEIDRRRAESGKTIAQIIEDAIERTRG
ncbi:MAG: hypothetical protein ACOX1O_01805 [Eggerthellaceae bacterium]|jgi:hypothetical protein